MICLLEMLERTLLMQFYPQEWAVRVQIASLFPNLPQVSEWQNKPLKPAQMGLPLLGVLFEGHVFPF